MSKGTQNIRPKSYQSPSDVIATGAVQGIAHGFGSTPGCVWTTIVQGHDGSGAAGTLAPVVTHGAHDATYLYVTVTAGALFRIHASL